MFMLHALFFHVIVTSSSPAAGPAAAASRQRTRRKNVKKRGRGKKPKCLTAFLDPLKKAAPSTSFLITLPKKTFTYG